MKLTQNERKAINEYENLLLEKFPNRIRKIILFGSKARGGSNRNSDLDLLIVLKRNDRQVEKEIACLTHEPIAKYLVLLSPIVVKEDFFREWSPLLEHVKKDGITLWTNAQPKKNLLR